MLFHIFNTVSEFLVRLWIMFVNEPAWCMVIIWMAKHGVPFCLWWSIALVCQLVYGSMEGFVKAWLRLG